MPRFHQTGLSFARTRGCYIVCHARYWYARIPIFKKNTPARSDYGLVYHALDFAYLTRDEISSALDRLLENKQPIERKLAEKHLHNGSIILDDLSSSYYTGKQSNLVQFGHNRDGMQVIYGHRLLIPLQVLYSQYVFLYLIFILLVMRA